MKILPTFYIFDGNKRKRKKKTPWKNIFEKKNEKSKKKKEIRNNLMELKQVRGQSFSKYKLKFNHWKSFAQCINPSHVYINKNIDRYTDAFLSCRNIIYIYETMTNGKLFQIQI